MEQLRALRRGQETMKELEPLMRIQEAEVISSNIERLREGREDIKSRAKARKWAPVKSVAKIGGNVAKEVLGTSIMGMAGVAQGMQPGRGGPQRAQRLFGVQTPTAPVVRPRADLSALRSAVIPKGVRADVHRARKLRLF